MNKNFKPFLYFSFIFLTVSLIVALLLAGIIPPTLLEFQFFIRIAAFLFGAIYTAEILFSSSLDNMPSNENSIKKQAPEPQRGKQMNDTFKDLFSELSDCLSETISTAYTSSLNFFTNSNQRIINEKMRHKEAVRNYKQCKVGIQDDIKQIRLMLQQRIDESRGLLKEIATETSNKLTSEVAINKYSQAYDLNETLQTMIVNYPTIEDFSILSAHEIESNHTLLDEHHHEVKKLAALVIDDIDYNIRNLKITFEKNDQILVRSR